MTARFAEDAKDWCEKLVVPSYKVMEETLPENDNTIIELGSHKIS